MADPIDPAAAKPEGNTAVEPAAATPVAAAPVVPDTYTLTKPDGSILPDEALVKASDIAKTLKLTNDADAQRLVGLADELARETIKTYEAARQPEGAVFKELVAQYEAESLKHPELGNGDRQVLAQKAVNAGLVLKQFAPELKPVLEQAGLANKAEFLLAMNRIHAAMQEKTLATGQPTQTVATGYKALFPDGIPDDVGASTARP